MSRPIVNPLEYYARQSPITEPREHVELLQGLPLEIPALCRVVQGILLHVFWTEGGAFNPRLMGLSVETAVRCPLRRLLFRFTPWLRRARREDRKVVAPFTKIFRAPPRAAQSKQSPPVVLHGCTWNRGRDRQLRR